MSETWFLRCDPVIAAEFLRALAHPMRLQILCRLAEGELAVAGFEAELGLRQPSLSQQLGLLREAGLVVTRREAKSIVYNLSDEKVRVLLHALTNAFSARTPNAGDRREPLDKRLARTRAASGPRSSHTPPTHRTPGGECGVFAVAGWPAGRFR